MTSFPHNLVLDSQPRFGFTPSEVLNLYNFLIDYRMFMKIVAKYSAFSCLPYQVHVKNCNPIPLCAAYRGIVIQLFLSQYIWQ